MTTPLQTLALSVLVFTCHSAVFAGEQTRNVFERPGAAPDNVLRVPPAIPTQPAAVNLPLPPTAAQPKLLLPPPIPAMEGDLRLPPMTLSAESAATPADGSAPRPAPAAIPKRVFLTQAELKVQRDRCGIAKATSTEAHVGSSGGRVRLQYQISNGRGCLSGAAANTAWAGVVSADEKTAIIDIQPNSTGASRQASVSVLARNGQPIVFTISQDPNSN